MRKLNISPITSSLSRRTLLGGAALIPISVPVAAAADGNPEQRAEQAFQTRRDAALIERSLSLPDHPTNGDELRYPNRIASYSKGLPHNDLGEVDPGAYNALLAALATSNTKDFEQLSMGCPEPARQRPFVNPQSGKAFDL